MSGCCDQTSTMCDKTTPLNLTRPGNSVSIPVQSLPLVKHHGGDLSPSLSIPALKLVSSSKLNQTPNS
ncbi:hypothetical protein E2C01_099170 [Portunus trituberculatus]|uniref:Uncharacterized protein n=1 Tax=Portunus trituberculatus TaxID=210409 RepID=A0A5B7KEQ5_PORTR|nr:hypothetical protein [Portunus trituberculatus]